MRHFCYRACASRLSVSAGTNAGGVIFPIIFPKLIDKYGKQMSIRIYAVALAIGLFPVLPFMKARLPESRVHGPARRGAPKWLRSRHFWFFVGINMIQGFGHFVPLIWLPSALAMFPSFLPSADTRCFYVLAFAAGAGLSTSQSSLALTLANATSCASGFTMGFLSDRLNIWALALCSLVCTSFVTFVFWGVLSYSLSGILLYGLAYGSTAGGWSSMWYGFIRPVASACLFSYLFYAPHLRLLSAEDDPSVATTIFAFLLLGRGIGNIVSTPISTALQHKHTLGHHAHKLGFMVADGQYADMIVYTGACFAGASALAMIGWGYDRHRK